MAVLRFLCALLTLVAVLALVSDATPALSGAGAFDPQSFGSHWADLSPKTLESVKGSVSRAASPEAWAALEASVLRVPSFLLFGGLAALMGYLGRRRHRIVIYTN